MSSGDKLTVMLATLLVTFLIVVAFLIDQDTRRNDRLQETCIEVRGNWAEGCEFDK